METKQECDFQYVKNGLLFDHYIITSSEITNDLTFMSLLSPEDFSYIPVSLLSNDYYTTKKTFKNYVTRNALFLFEDFYEYIYNNSSSFTLSDITTLRNDFSSLYYWLAK